jgi:hypothetical protein
MPLGGKRIGTVWGLAKRIRGPPERHGAEGKGEDIARALALCPCSSPPRLPADKSPVREIHRRDQVKDQDAARTPERGARPSP